MTPEPAVLVIRIQAPALSGQIGEAAAAITDALQGIGYTLAAPSAGPWPSTTAVRAVLTFSPRPGRAEQE